MNSQEISRNIFKKRSIDELIQTGKKSELKKTLNVFDLIVIGIGAVVGTGIFAIIGAAITGNAETPGAGHAIIISIILAALACVVPALCYSEIASMIPVAGSAYAYTYATMGEFMAWMVGWILMLEYAIGNITVASAWSGYFMQFMKGFKAHLPAFILNIPLWLKYDYRTIYSMCEKYGWNIHDKIPYLFDKIPIAINMPAAIIVLILTLLLIRGVKESTRAASIMVGVNMFIILSFIVFGAFYVKPENWTPFLPAVHPIAGILMGTFTIFFAYVGVDAISTAAEETEKPQRDLPIAILGTLGFCTILYICVALVLTGIVPIDKINITAPLPHAISYLHVGRISNIFAGMISVGALCALTTVLLVYQLGTTRILYAISRDRFLPRSWRMIHRKFRTPYVMTWISGIVVIICGLFMDLKISADLCNYGTFTSFVIICLCVLILRKTAPDKERPFKVPFCPWLPIAGILICLVLIFFSLKTLKTSSSYFIIWMLLGLLIYALYGYRQKRKAERKRLQ
ncbi:MAG TPA: amino acid permease [Cyanobacteria bacterium UBA11991]|nr:amino acid permease [Cyanobacteriota bacterium]MDY6359104.1 amino acid permease [Cyanobacteriota bacterium]MDY6363371.1 amino acid permease [Cyanobacteriota bacterium]MDY6382877.1 amino acid permease [Cyanobacteriota bacterium]HCB11086.1 amino acid permease [Cyanobacteria bacterium UBA11991]